MVVIRFCDMCGAKLPKSSSKFCPECGAAIGGKAALPQQPAAPANPKGEAGGAKPAPNPMLSAFAIALGVMIVIIIVMVLIDAGNDRAGSNPILTALRNIGSELTGSGPSAGLGSNAGATQICADRSGSVTCGYCNLDVVLSSNPHAGKCRYCPNGTVCSGEICGELTCKNAGQTPGDGTTTPGSGNNQPGNGAVGVITEFTFDSRTGCPVQGSTSSRGGVDLQCSQMVPMGRCSMQSCECYYSDAHGSNANVYYHTSDGAYFPCSGNGQIGIDCRAAAQATVNHCGPATN